MGKLVENLYKRYHIENIPVDDIRNWPNRFRVHVGKIGLLKLLVKELFHTRGNREVMLSRPCMYGVFSGPLGGFMPRPEHCVGCLRCMTEYPEFVQITHNTERQKLGDSFFHFGYINAISYESQTGLVPVKGAGYRGKFGGQGWDGMWTDMSEIVRPTRDGIHGREFISTLIDIGYKPNFLSFDENGEPIGALPSTFNIPVPILFDVPPNVDKTDELLTILAKTAKEIDSIAIIPLKKVIELGLEGRHVVPLVGPEDIEAMKMLSYCPNMIEMHGWDEEVFRFTQKQFPSSMVCLRTIFPEGDELMSYVSHGVHIFHLTANFHGRGEDGTFVIDLIRSAHESFVNAGIREEVSLIGSGGIVAAEHIPKAIICGLDAVAINTPAVVALQGDFSGECIDENTCMFTLPKDLDIMWGIQRLKNMVAAWRDQMIEVLGAMGLREVRRLRGEMGRAMFMVDLEADAFSDIEGYEYGISE
jgi:hypothetical protein